MLDKNFKFSNVLILGDSHSYVCHTLKNFSYNVFQEFSLKKLNRGDFAHDILTVLEREKHNLIVFSVGEIDCRLVIYQRYIEEERTYEDIISEMVEKYFSYLNTLNYPICLLGIPPCGLQDVNFFGMKYYADREERIKIFKIFNEIMKEASKKYNYFYIDMYEKTKDSEGLIAEEYREDAEYIALFCEHRTHLNFKAGVIVQEYIKSYFAN